MYKYYYEKDNHNYLMNHIGQLEKCLKNDYIREILILENKIEILKMNLLENKTDSVENLTRQRELLHYQRNLENLKKSSGFNKVVVPLSDFDHLKEKQYISPDWEKDISDIYKEDIYTI